MYKLIAFDLDGTLINKKHTISKETINAIDRAKKQGLYVTIATGRFFGSAVSIAKKLKINAPMIANDGAQIQDVFTGKLISFTPVNPDTCFKVIQILKNFPDVEIQFFFKNKKAYIGRNFKANQLKKYLRIKKFNIEGLINYIRDFVLGPVIEVQNLDEIIPHLENGVAKIVVSGKPTDIKVLRQNLHEEIGAEITITSAIKNYIDILDKGVSKAEGLKLLSKELNIKREQIVAVGDNFNDIDMIKYAGMGVAMGNAPQAVKKAAQKVITNSDENGIAQLIDELLNKPKIEDPSSIKKSV